MPAPAARPGMLSLSIKDKASLYAAYMPYVCLLYTSDAADDSIRV